MIFVTTGGGIEWKFDRLVRYMDELVLEFKEDEIFIQKGCADYNPINTKYCNFVKLKKAFNLFRKADIVIGHAGAGTVLLCNMSKKPFIAVPRKEEFREIFDNHQFDLAGYIKRYKWVKIANGKDEIRDAIRFFKDNYKKENLDFVSSKKENVVNKIRQILNVWDNRNEI